MSGNTPVAANGSAMFLPSLIDWRTIMMPASMITLPEVRAQISSASKMGTPDCSSVPSVRVKRDTAIFRMSAGEGTWTLTPNLTDVTGLGFHLATQGFSPVQAQIVVTNTNDSGPGSLRQAILDTNSVPLQDFIDFAIPGNGVHSGDVPRPVSLKGLP